ncbi:MAG: hydrolase [Candidatus Abyssobacteria bacterium SURF_5]|uniref:Hydrolase n=1 Tax=Abyssobacteria bacterium (strain SURF_5) TaxID=2093360 RepID=A0A3A4NLU2_ABYX5|nr:MAG: hydrolase [Candidatus Abyssubacteria bacterium SURF_5]
MEQRMMMRHRQILSRSNSALLVIDYQEKLLAAFANPDPFIGSCIKLIRFAKTLDLPILWTEQYPQGLGRTIEQVKQELTGLEPIEKVSFSCFGDSRFASAVSRLNRAQLIVCGIETHICVAQTVLDALEAGYQPQVAADACGSRRESDHEFGLRKMENAGSVLTTAEAAMYEVLARSDTAEFRKILKIVK